MEAKKAYCLQLQPSLRQTNPERCQPDQRNERKKNDDKSDSEPATRNSNPFALCFCDASPIIPGVEAIIPRAERILGVNLQGIVAA